MQTQIQSSDFTLTESLKSFIDRHIKRSITTHSDQIEQINVRLRDVNGPKGGNDKECVVEVLVAKLPPIVVKKRSSDAYASIRKAVGRASRVVHRKLSKRRSKLKQSIILEA